MPKAGDTLRFQPHRGSSCWSNASVLNTSDDGSFSILSDRTSAINALGIALHVNAGIAVAKLSSNSLGQFCCEDLTVEIKKSGSILHDDVLSTSDYTSRTSTKRPLGRLFDRKPLIHGEPAFDGGKGASRVHVDAKVLVLVPHLGIDHQSVLEGCWVEGTVVDECGTFNRPA